MNTKELIEQLSIMPPTAEVIFVDAHGLSCELGWVAKEDETLVAVHERPPNHG